MSGLILRRDLNRKLTTEEVDGNFLYLQGLSQSGPTGPQGPQGPAGGGGSGSPTGSIQNIIGPTDVIEVKTKEQYLVYGDLDLQGELDNAGNVTVINGNLLNSGTFSNSGSYNNVVLFGPGNIGSGLTYSGGVLKGNPYGITGSVQYKYNNEFYSDDNFYRGPTSGEFIVGKDFQTTNMSGGLRIIEYETDVPVMGLFSDGASYSSQISIIDASFTGLGENTVVLNRGQKNSSKDDGAQVILTSLAGSTQSVVFIAAINNDFNGTYDYLSLGQQGLAYNTELATFSYPRYDGSAGDVLTTDGAGNLSFTASGGSGCCPIVNTLTTTNATPGNIVTLIINTYSNTGWIVTADVVGRYGYTASYGAKVWATFKLNNAGIVEQVDTTDLVEKTQLTTATCDISTNGYVINIKVTGETGKNIDWKTFYTTNIM